MGASAGGIRAGQAYVELLADDRPLQAGLAAAQRHLSEWGEHVRKLGLAVFAAGAGMVTPLIAAAKQFASSGDALDKLATRTGMSVELLSELKYAAGASGASLEDLEHASRTLSITIVDAMKGSQSAIEALGGVDLAKRLNALTQDQRFLAVAHAVALIPEPARRAAAAMAVFGKSGTQLLPLVAEMENLRGEARKLGATMSTEQAQKAAALQDAWERIEGAITRVSKAFGAALAPALTRAADEVLPVLVAIKQWAAHNQMLIVSFAKVGAVIAAVGGVILGVATVFTSLAWVFQALNKAIGVVTGTFVLVRAAVMAVATAISVVPGLITSVIGVVETAVAALPGLLSGLATGMVSGFALLRTAVVALPAVFTGAFTALPALIGLALNPVTLLGAAIIGLGVTVYEMTDGGQTALGQLGQAFREVAEDAVTAFGAISEALSTGDLVGAVKILWAAIQLEWTRGVAWIENIMSAFAGGVEKLFLNVGFGINVAFWTAVNGIQAAIDWVIGGIVKAFSTVIGTIAAEIADLLNMVGALDEDTSQKIANLSSTITTRVDEVRAGRSDERDQRVGNLNGLWDQSIANVNTRMADGMTGRDAEIAAKRAELDAAIAEAHRARTATAEKDNGADGSGDAPATPEFDTAALSSELAQRMNTVQLKVDTIGAFNTSAIGEMGIGGTAAERGLQAQEKTARNTERIMTSVESNNLSFG